MTRHRMAGAADRLVAAATAAMLLNALSAPLARGQTPVVRGDDFSLEDAVRLAVEREPALQAERTQIDVARGNRSQAGLKPNPMVSVGRQQQPGGSDNQTTLSVEWPLDLFRVKGRVAVADGELDAARFRVDDRERHLVADVRAAYGAAAAAQRDLDVLTQLADTATRQLDVVRSRVETGAAPALERDLLVVERRRIDADRLLLDARVTSARLALQRLLGRDPTEQVTLRDSLESLVDVRDAPVPTTSAVAVPRPDVQAAAAGVRVADAALDRARRDGRLDVALFGSYTRMQTSFPQLGVGPGGGLEPVGAGFHYLAAGAMLTLPWRNDNRGEIAAADARRRGATADYEATELQARTEVASARILEQQARAAVAMYAADIRPLARQNLDVLRQTYDLGRGTLGEVLTEQRRYLELERAYTDTLKQAYDARTALLSALGGRP